MLQAPPGQRPPRPHPIQEATGAFRRPIVGNSLEGLTALGQGEDFNQGRALALLVVAASRDVRWAADALDDVIQQLRGQLLDQLSVRRVVVAVVTMRHDIGDPLLFVAIARPRAGNTLDQELALRSSQETNLVRPRVVQQHLQAVTQVLDARAICGRQAAHRNQHGGARVVRKDR